MNAQPIAVCYLESAWLLAVHTHGVVPDRDIRAELAGRGHRVASSASPIATPVMLFIDQENGQFHAADDPAAGRHPAGLAT